MNRLFSSNHTETGGNRINQILWRVATLRESWSKNSGHKDTGHKRKPNQVRASEPNGKWTLLFPGVFFIVSVDKSDYSCARSSTRNNSRYGLKKKRNKKNPRRLTLCALSTILLLSSFYLNRFVSDKRDIPKHFEARQISTRSWSTALNGHLSFSLSLSLSRFNIGLTFISTILLIRRSLSNSYTSRVSRTRFSVRTELLHEEKEKEKKKGKGKKKKDVGIFRTRDLPVSPTRN